MHRNRLFNRGIIALSLVIVMFLLSSCGGGSSGYGGGGGMSGAPTYTIGVTVTGLSMGNSVVLTEFYLSKDVTISANGSYTFPAAAVAIGALYSVSVKAGGQLTGQTCTVKNASGIVGVTNITNVDVTCV